MFRYWHRIILGLLLLAGPALAGDDPAEKGRSPEPGREDMEVIAMMEMLQLVDLVESMELINDMDVLIEEEQNGTQD